MASAGAEAIKVELVAFAEALPTDPPPELQAMRDADATLGNTWTNPDGVTWTDVDVDGIRAIWADPDGGATDRALLYVHGGGYAIGAAEYYRNMCGHLAKAIWCRLMILHDRLAPPHRAPVEQGGCGFQWLRAQGFDAIRIAVSGDSAGGGLTITRMPSLRDQEVLDGDDQADTCVAEPEFEAVRALHHHALGRRADQRDRLILQRRLECPESRSISTMPGYLSDAFAGRGFRDRLAS